MDKNPQVSGRQIAAGRVLAGIGRERLATRAGIPLDALQMIETGSPSACVPAGAAAALRAALEQLGVEFIPPNGGGEGVRLKFSPSEVRRIATLEGEGGIVADDDI